MFDNAFIHTSASGTNETKGGGAIGWKTEGGGAGRGFPGKCAGDQLRAMMEETLQKLPPIETLVARLPQHMLAKALETAVQVRGI